MENNISRNKEHELIMISIYDALTYISMNEQFSLEDTMENIFMVPYEDIPYFSKSVTIKALMNINQIESTFQEHMPKWKFDRLNQVERAILLESYASYKLTDEKIDKNVIIDVAVNLAKKYLDIKDYKFVNAILDKVL
ncbi:MAG TPA: hypothetical protein DDW20_03370 [Firmicutes bacterium]|nr:hypothetical protein [Bacillota bacterium]